MPLPDGATPDAGAGPDAGFEEDAGPMPVDAGDMRDAAASVDAGPTDGGPPSCGDGDGVLTRAELPLPLDVAIQRRVAFDVAVDTHGAERGDGSRLWDFEGPFEGDADRNDQRRPLTGEWFAESFPGATYTLPLSAEDDLLGVFELTDDALLLRGVVSPDDGTFRTELEYDPPVGVWRLPLEEGDAWDETSTVSGGARRRRQRLHRALGRRGRRGRRPRHPGRCAPRAARQHVADANGGRGADDHTSPLLRRGVRGHGGAGLRRRRRRKRRADLRGRAVEGRPVTRARIALVLAVATLASGCMGFHTGPMPGEPADATFVQIEGARVRYVDEGEGEPVVLIHGFASSLAEWAPVLPALRENHRVLAMDLKGFGWTDRPEGDYSPEAQARLVLALMDERGVDRAAVVAHSWGSSVALASRSRRRSACRASRSTTPSSTTVSATHSCSGRTRTGSASS